VGFVALRVGSQPVDRGDTIISLVLLRPHLPLRCSTESRRAIRVYKIEHRDLVWIQLGRSKPLRQRRYDQVLTERAWTAGNDNM